MSEEKQTFDLASTDTVKGANRGFDVTLYHPGTQKDLDIVITILGKDSDEFQKVSKAQQKRRMSKFSKGGFRPNVAFQAAAEELEADNIVLLASCTLGWKQGEKNTITIDGAEIAFSRDNAEMVYERFPWIREQIDTAMGDRANFIKN